MVGSGPAPRAGGSMSPGWAAGGGKAAGRTGPRPGGALAGQRTCAGAPHPGSSRCPTSLSLSAWAAAPKLQKAGRAAPWGPWRPPRAPGHRPRRASSPSRRGAFVAREPKLHSAAAPALEVRSLPSKGGGGSSALLVGARKMGRKGTMRSQSHNRALSAAWSPEPRARGAPTLRGSASAAGPSEPGAAAAPALTLALTHSLASAGWHARRRAHSPTRARWHRPVHAHTAMARCGPGHLFMAGMFPVRNPPGRQRSPGGHNSFPLLFCFFELDSLSRPVSILSEKIQ